MKAEIRDDTLTSQETPQIASRPPAVKKRSLEQILSHSLRLKEPCQHLDVVLLTSRTLRN